MSTIVRHPPQRQGALSKRIASELAERGAVDVSAYACDGLRVVLARWPTGHDGTLEQHMSVSHPKRWPDWDDITWTVGELLHTPMVIIVPGRFDEQRFYTVHLVEIPRRRAAW